MKSRALIVAGLAILAPFASTPVFAANGTIGAAIEQFAAPLERIKFPVVGLFRDVSLNSLPPLANLKLPLFGHGIPVVSSLTVDDGVVTLSSLYALKSPLPGLGSLTATVTKITAKLP